MRRFRLLQTRKIVNPFPVMARKERTHPRIQNQVSIRTNGRKEKFLLTTQIKQKCPLNKNVRRLYVIHCQMYVTRLKSFLLSYFVINLVISNMCFACAVGNWPSCNNTVGRKMRIVACHNRCNSKPMGAFNTKKFRLKCWKFHLPNGTTSTRAKPLRVWLLFLQMERDTPTLPILI